MVPVRGTLWTGEFGLRRLLICDFEAATHNKSDGSPKERK